MVQLAAAATKMFWWETTGVFFCFHPSHYGSVYKQKYNFTNLLTACCFAALICRKGLYRLVQTCATPPPAGGCTSVHDQGCADTMRPLGGERDEQDTGTCTQTGTGYRCINYLSNAQCYFPLCIFSAVINVFCWQVSSASCQKWLVLIHLIHIENILFRKCNK